MTGINVTSNAVTSNDVPPFSDRFHTVARAKTENDLTIEELAAKTGMTVRNIRSHRARGLLPAPEVRDRVGYYGPEHLDRLRMIQELQGDGFNLKGIERLLEPEPRPRRAVPLLQTGDRRVRPRDAADVHPGRARRALRHRDRRRA